MLIKGLVEASLGVLCTAVALKLCNCHICQLRQCRVINPWGDIALWAEQLATEVRKELHAAVEQQTPTLALFSCVDGQVKVGVMHYISEPRAAY